MIGMTLVDQVTAENPIKSPDRSLPRFTSALKSARFAMLPLETSTASRLPCHRAKFSSNDRHWLPKLSFRERMIKLHKARFVSFSRQKVDLTSLII
jgi:hypothetical protein